MEKRKITLTAIILAVVLVALFGSTYAYFTSNNDPKNSLDATITTGSLSLILDDIDGITEEDKIDANHTEIVKYFKLTNNGVGDAYANLIWKGLLNTFVRDDLVYELEEVQADKTSFSDKRMVVTETVVPKTNTNENISLANGILVKAGTISGNTITPNIQYYKLTVKYKYSDTENQNEDLNKVLVSGFDLGEGAQQKVRLTLNVGEDATIDTNTIDVTYTGTYESLPTPVRSGKIFGGWYTDENYTNRVLSTSMVSLNTNSMLYAKWNENPIKMIDANGNEVHSSGPLTAGQRFSIGDQTFIYIRTTDDTSYYNDCTNETACENNISCKDGDQSEYSIIKKGAGYLRLFAEYNINVGSNKNPNVPEGIQHESIRGLRYDGGTKYGNVRFDGNTVIYNLNSELKRYIDDYATYLNDTYFGGADIVSASGITKQELNALGCDIRSGNCSTICPNAQSWVYSTTYWTSSSRCYNRSRRIRANNFSDCNAYWDDYYNESNTAGVRPVIMIKASDLEQ